MSIKVHNAYKLASVPLYIHQVNELLQPARDAMKDSSIEFMGKSIASSAQHILDRHVAHALGFEVNIQEEDEHRYCSSSLSLAYSQIRESILEDRIKQRRNFLDPQASVCVFTNEDGTYALLYCESRQLSNVFVQTLGAQEYNYWDNADGPDDIPSAAWDERREVWKNLMGDWAAPVEQSASMNLVPDNIIYDTHPFLVHPGDKPEADMPKDWIQDFNRRMYQLALNTPAAGLPPDLAEKQAKTDSLSITMRHLRNLEKGEVPQFNEMIERLSEVMPKEYTIADLRTGFDQIAEKFGPKKRPSAKP